MWGVGGEGGRRESMLISTSGFSVVQRNPEPQTVMKYSGGHQEQGSTFAALQPPRWPGASLLSSSSPSNESLKQINS